MQVSYYVNLQYVKVVTLLYYDTSGNLLKLSRFPASWISEINELLFLAIQTCIKPERIDSLLNMSEAQAATLEQSLCVQLAVRKPSCSFDESFCVISQTVASMIRSYRLIVRPITAVRGYRAPRPAFLSSPRLVDVVKQSHTEWLSRPLVQKASHAGALSKNKWSLVLDLLKKKLTPLESQLSRFKKLTSSQISYVYYNNACDQFFRSPANAPLLQLNPATHAMVTLGFSPAEANQATTTLLRAKREQHEWENGDAISQSLVHDSLSHTRDSALHYYILPVTASLKARAAHSALSLASAPVHNRSQLMVRLHQEMKRLPYRCAELSTTDLSERWEGHLELKQYRKEQQLQQMRKEQQLALDLPEVDLDAFLPAASPAASGMMNDQDQSGDQELNLPSHRPAASFISTRPSGRVIWTVADKKALMAGIRKHKNGWSKMAADSTLLFSDDLIKSSSLQKVVANKLKAYARSPSFKSFLESVDNNKSS